MVPISSSSHRTPFGSDADADAEADTNGDPHPDLRMAKAQRRIAWLLWAGAIDTRTAASLTGALHAGGRARRATLRMLTVG